MKYQRKKKEKKRLMVNEGEIDFYKGFFVLSFVGLVIKHVIQSIAKF